MRDRILSLTTAAVAAFLIGTLTLPAQAQAQRGVPNPQTDSPQVRVAPGALQNALRQRPSNARSATQQEIQTLDPSSFGLIQPQTLAPWATIAAINPPDMAGWTPLTNGPSLGGPSVVTSSGGQATVVVRGTGNRLYLATIMPGSISGPVQSSAWKQTSLVVNSDVDCERHSNEADSFACAYLGAGGAAFAAWFKNGSYIRTISFGGQNGGARPAFRGQPHEYVMPMGSQPINNPAPWLIDNLTLVTWDGGAQTYQRYWLTSRTLSMGGMGQPVSQLAPEADGWKILSGPTLTPMSCVGNSCVVGSSNGVRMFSGSSDSTTSGAINSPALSAGVSNTSAPELVRTASGADIAVVRGNNGRIYQSRRSGNGAFGAWRDEGGSARAGSNISCLAINEQPICFIQGADGRIWFKRFATESGL